MAASADAFAVSVTPDTIPGGKPVTDVPGESPRSPVNTELPVFVTVVPANTAYDDAAPRLTNVAADAVTPANAVNVRNETAVTAMARSARRHVVAARAERGRRRIVATAVKGFEGSASTP